MASLLQPVIFVCNPLCSAEAALFLGNSARSCVADQYITVIISFYPPCAASLKHRLRWLHFCMEESHLPPGSLTCSPLCSLPVCLSPFPPPPSVFSSSFHYCPPFYFLPPSMAASHIWDSMQPSGREVPLCRNRSVTSDFEMQWNAVRSWGVHTRTIKLQTADPVSA